MHTHEQAVLERLVEIADGSSGQAGYVVDFLLAWWNVEECGGVDLTRLWSLDTAIAADVVTVFGLISRVHQYPDTLGYKSRFDRLVRAWRKPVFA